MRQDCRCLFAILPLTKISRNSLRIISGTNSAAASLFLFWYPPGHSLFLSAGVVAYHQ
jgi:hypothetical protein